MSARIAAAITAACAALVLALLVTMTPVLDVAPAPKGFVPTTIPAPCPRGGAKC